MRCMAFDGVLVHIHGLGIGFVNLERPFSRNTVDRGEYSYGL